MRMRCVLLLVTLSSSIFASASAQALPFNIQATLELISSTGGSGLPAGAELTLTSGVFDTLTSVDLAPGDDTQGRYEAFGLAILEGLPGGRTIGSTVDTLIVLDDASGIDGFFLSVFGGAMFVELTTDNLAFLEDSPLEQGDSLAVVVAALQAPGGTDLANFSPHANVATGPIPTNEGVVELFYTVTNLNLIVVPEPSAAFLMGLGLVGLGVRRRSN